MLASPTQIHQAGPVGGSPHGLATRRERGAGCLGAKLRSLLLHHALPEEHHGLIESPEPGAQAVLCDVLLALEGCP